MKGVEEVAVDQVGFWSLFSESGEIEFQSSANHEPTMAVPIATKGSKVEMMEAVLVLVMLNQPIEVQRKIRTSDCS